MRKRNSDTVALGNQDSFLDIITNVVGILIILVMIAGVKAQSSPPPSSETTADGLLTETLQKIDEGERLLGEKAESIAVTRTRIEEIDEQTLLLQEQTLAQTEQYAALFDLMTSIRAGIEIEAEQKDQTLKDVLELKRQLLEQDTKLDQLDKTKTWMLAHRPQATVLENMPTPIGRTVDDNDKEIHFRLKGGRIAYVPFMELRTRLIAEISENSNRLSKQQSASGTIGPLDGFNMQYVVVTYDVLMNGTYGSGVGSRIELDYVELVPLNENLGEPAKQAIASPNSEFANRVKRYRQDIYTITIWVYPDSFEEYRELKKFLYAKGYQVAARPMEFGQPISGSPRGTKSAAQ